MTDVARLVFLGLVGAWAGAVALAILRVRVLVRRRGRGAAWPAVRTLLPLADLVGTWAGALAAAALLWGRVGFGAAWAAALGLVALMATASLYDRAVLLPSLDAAFKRLPADPRWEDEWRFLWRMGAWGRGVTLAMAVGAAACACVA